MSFKDIRRKVARIIDPSYEKEVDAMVGARVARVMNEMDPYEPLMRDVHSVFSAEWTRPEEKLNEPSQLSMKMWAYGQVNDPNFKHLTDWIINTQGVAMLRAPARTDEERSNILMWGKAQISAIILFVKEIGRLSSLYEEILEKNKKDNFESDLSVE